MLNSAIRVLDRRGEVLLALSKHVYINMLKAEQIGDALEGRVSLKGVNKSYIAVYNNVIRQRELIESEVFC